MRHLNLSPFDLHKLDLVDFTFPALHHASYTERNGWNEMETVERVWAMDTEKVDLFYTSDYFEHSSELIEEVRIWNSDPKKYWTELLIPLIEEDIKSKEKVIEARRKALKKSKKALKKLKGE
jgi:hypothetical protein